MNTPAATIAILGGGLSAHIAHREIEAAGVEVVLVHPKAPGATALWSGYGGVFGPSSAMLPPFVGDVEAIPMGAWPAALPFSNDPVERLWRLRMRRPFHPYAMLGLADEELDADVHDALVRLGYAGLVPNHMLRVYPSAYGTPVAADLTARATQGAYIQRGERVAVVAMDALVDWRAASLVRSLRECAGVDAEIVYLDGLSDLLGADVHPVQAARQLVALWLERPEALLSAWQEALVGHQAHLALFPPCMGPDWAQHEEMWGTIASALRAHGIRAAEAPGSRHAIHGWRLDQHLRQTTGGPTVAIRATASRCDDCQRSALRYIELDNFEKIEVDAVIVATGKFIGRGMPTKAPMSDPVTGAPLWIDGAPVPNGPIAHPPNFFDARPWEDHPMMRLGLAINPQSQILGLDHQPAWENVFAAGRILTGTNPFHDGTEMGVDLVSGLRAARSALAYLGIAPAREENQ